MEKFHNDMLCKLETAINELEAESDCSLQRIETVILLIMECLYKVKEYVLKKGFKNTNEEIRFFKYQKPAILAKLIYYNTIYKIETNKPHGTKSIRQYLNRELKNLKRYFDNNLDFYKYYRTNSSYLDEKLFVRNNHDIKLCLDTRYYQFDPNFSTSHDYMIAKIIANGLIQVYLEDQLYNNQKGKSIASRKLIWTGSKVALIELIYALHYQGAFNNGNADIKLITRYFENTFNINLGNFYQTYLELRSRKMKQTKFLDTLREGLIRKMEEQDER